MEGRREGVSKQYYGEVGRDEWGGSVGRVEWGYSTKMSLIWNWIQIISNFAKVWPGLVLTPRRPVLIPFCFVLRPYITGFIRRSPNPSTLSFLGSSSYASPPHPFSSHLCPFLSSFFSFYPGHHWLKTNICSVSSLLRHWITDSLK